MISQWRLGGRRLIRSLPSQIDHRSLSTTVSSNAVQQLCTTTRQSGSSPVNSGTTSRFYHYSFLLRDSKKTLADFDLSSDVPKDVCNVTSHIAAKVGTNLHLHSEPIPHPLYLLQRKIHAHFGTEAFHHFDDLHPVVTTQQNFDSLLIPSDHVSRSMSDTYYLEAPDYCLRCHTSAHQVELLQHFSKQNSGAAQFLVTGDVYRRDEIDSSHYPIFHQMEGVKVFTNGESQEQVLEDLKQHLEGLARVLFGPDVPIRWNEDFFPFTDPSLELEVMFEDSWMEVLGCGVMQPKILEAGGYDVSAGHKAWAFGLGLERLAMVLFKIPDIRYFWSVDERFWEQFKNVTPEQPIDSWPTFQVYSKYPSCYKDISFWLDNGTSSETTSAFHVHNFYELVRGVGGDLVETVEIVDQFVHPKTQRESHCYRIVYRSMDRSLTNKEIDVLQEQVRELTESELDVELR